MNSWKQMGVLLIVLLFIAGKHLRFKEKIAFFVFAFLAHPFICFVSNCPACLKCKHLLSSYQDSPVGCQNSSDLSTIDNSGLWYLSQKILFLKRLVLTRTISFSIWLKEMSKHYLCKACDMIVIIHETHSWQKSTNVKAWLGDHL